jgi:hypothetical protein
MVACLNALGLAWTATTASGALPVILDLLDRAGIGAVVYAVALMALWLLVGRPDGAERYLLRILGKLGGKLRLPGMVRS